jgi:hypothetical protein
MGYLRLQQVVRTSGRLMGLFYGSQSIHEVLNRQNRVWLTSLGLYHRGGSHSADTIDSAKSATILSSGASHTASPMVIAFYSPPAIYF